MIKNAIGMSLDLPRKRNQAGNKRLTVVSLLQSIGWISTIHFSIIVAKHSIQSDPSFSPACPDGSIIDGTDLIICSIFFRDDARSCVCTLRRWLITQHDPRSSLSPIILATEQKSISQLLERYRKSHSCHWSHLKAVLCCEVILSCHPITSGRASSNI